MNISIIVAIGKNREIGLNNQLLWRLSHDLKNFKKLTMGHHILMGRKTFESIGKALPGRKTIIVTRDKNYTFSECDVVHSFEDAVKLAKENGEDELFICGGETIYEAALPYATKLYLTHVEYSGEADTYFPEVQYSDWKKIYNEQFPQDSKNEYASRYEVLEKI